MTPQEFQLFFPKVEAWIKQTLSNNAPKAQTVASLNFKRLPLYFSQGLLNSAKVVTVQSVPVPPLSRWGMHQFAAFEQGNYHGITFLDTYFVQDQHAPDEGLHFHELIHVIQWKILGPQLFLAAYASGLESVGYQNSPLEAMAYHAQDGFRKFGAPFDVEAWVAEQLRIMFGQSLPRI